ncbi:MAG: hypothetical protein K2N11_02460 [Mucispirillum sp.]|nr:hypothetical protein [Mucispirillum sp.]
MLKKYIYFYNNHRIKANGLTLLQDNKFVNVA